MTKAQKVRMARRAAVRHGVDPDIFVRQIGAETGWADDVWTGQRGSSAGARGAGQFIPSTAKAYGVDVTDPRSSLDGAARYMKANLKKYGSYRAALSVYNSGRPDGYKRFGETKAYVKTILGGRNPRYREGAGSSSTSVPGETIRVPGGTVQGAQSSTIAGIEPASVGLPELRQTQTPTVANPVMPSFAAGPSMPQGAGAGLDLSAYKSATLPAIRDVLEQQAAAGAPPLPGATESPDIQVPGITARVPGKRVRTPIKGRGGWAGSQGVAEDLAGLTGLTPTSTKRQRQKTSSGNNSDHWVGTKNGYAIDLGSKTGNPKALERAARTIARELGIRNYRPGRIYNVNRNGYRIQLIYGAAVGHGDHVHVGVKKIR